MGDERLLLLHGVLPDGNRLLVHVWFVDEVVLRAEAALRESEGHRWGVPSELTVEAT